jgi:hypothetical protein
MAALNFNAKIAVVLAMRQNAPARTRIKALDALADAALAEIDQIREDCEHNFKPEPFGSESCRCAECGEDGGWICPASQDRRCHYYGGPQELLKISSKPGEFLPLYQFQINGVAVDARFNRHELMESDCCAFCGKPEERK